MIRARVLLPALLLPFLLAATAPAPKTIVVCAPGYPGDSASAQPLMDRFAAAAAAAAGSAPGSLRAVYHETAEAGIRRLREPGAALALVTLPFFLEHGRALGLEPELQVVQEGGAEEVWSLAARKGAVASPAALAGWEITGMPGYAPAFIRGPVLGGWGPLPGTARITFTAAVLSALRRAAGGEDLAVLLDPAQAAGLGSLPFASDLEVVARSRPLPGSLLCTVGRRLDGAAAGPLLRGLLALHERGEGPEVLRAMRMVRFRAVDRAAIETVRRDFESGRDPGPSRDAPAR